MFESRICLCCGKSMVEGYVINEYYLYYFCSKKCLNTKFTDEEFKEIYENDTGCYTEWKE